MIHVKAHGDPIKLKASIRTSLFLWPGFWVKRSRGGQRMADVRQDRSLKWEPMSLVVFHRKRERMTPARPCRKAQLLPIGESLELAVQLGQPARWNRMLVLQQTATTVMVGVGCWRLQNRWRQILPQAAAFWPKSRPRRALSLCLSPPPTFDNQKSNSRVAYIFGFALRPAAQYPSPNLVPPAHSGR